MIVQGHLRLLATWSVVASLLLALAYLLQPNVTLRLWVVSNIEHNEGYAESVNRPKILLHPKDHAFRSPMTQYLEWRISSKQLRPDGVLKQVYLINGQFRCILSPTKSFYARDD